MNLNQTQNVCYFQQANMGQYGGFCRQAATGPNCCFYQVAAGSSGGCYQQISMGSNGNYFHQIIMGPNGCCCQQTITNPNGSNYQQMVMNMNGSNNFTNASNNQHIPSGQLVRERRNLPLFEGIHVSGCSQVFLTQADDESVTVEADENHVRHVDTNVQNRILYVSCRSSFSMNDHPNVYVSMKKIQQIYVSSSSSLTGQSVIKMDDLKIDVHGSSKLDLQLNSQRINLYVSSSSDASLSGFTNFVSARISSSSNLSASCLVVNDFDISINASSSAKISPKNSLGFDVSVASSLKFGSNPIIQRAICNSASSVNHNYF